MKRAFAVVLFASAVWLAGPAAGQDKAAALDKARTKFETEVAKADEALLASLDKAYEKAKGAGNKQLTEKLAYERELFVSKRIVPSAVPAAAYVKQRSQAVAALEATYAPAIKDLTKAKKDEEAEALEVALSDLVKSARGYGLAIPALESRPALVIENKASGMILESELKEGSERLVLAPKTAKRKPAQAWVIEREEKGTTLRNVGNKMAVSYDPRFGPEFRLRLDRIDPNKEVPDRQLFQLTEARREVVIVSLVKGEAGPVLTINERKLKGVTVYDLVFEKRESPQTPNQLWTITEVK